MQNRERRLILLVIIFLFYFTISIPKKNIRAHAQRKGSSRVFRSHTFHRKGDAKLRHFFFFLKFFIQMQFIDMRYKQFEEKMQQQRKFSEAVDRTKHDINDDDLDSNESNDGFIQDNINSCEYQFELRMNNDLCQRFDEQMSVGLVLN